MPFEKNQELEEVIESVANESKLTTMALSVRDIQRMVKAQLGFEPSTSTVTRVLRRLGIDTATSGSRHNWVWRHK